ncbi:hypothetical protein EJ05DRAFT_70442 [Pseudovirgaria hyperparasitica]|uniref:Uncharacterized protein n=1 Tax=Pseudovirgaria hyperparasitica TaxID=470096 RepID=A0A6A6W3S9_9PEZI|nr:uncharacterized protein EJ05DRAFT_70442 [Pseudovirgaria hyperparasitica]KAF2756626.1 hypothetical protein EJ05DRAFT_70442 [Pseudovirgaria hyperparasitica]
MCSGPRFHHVASNLRSKDSKWERIHRNFEDSRISFRLERYSHTHPRPYPHPHPYSRRTHISLASPPLSITKVLGSSWHLPTCRHLIRNLRAVRLWTVFVRSSMSTVPRFPVQRILYCILCIHRSRVIPKHGHWLIVWHG